MLPEVRVHCLVTRGVPEVAGGERSGQCGRDLEGRGLRLRTRDLRRPKRQPDPGSRLKHCGGRRAAAESQVAPSGERCLDLRD